MPSEITVNSRVPFGARGNKDKRICDLPDSFLRWIVKNLTDTDHHAYALAAGQALEQRARDGQNFAAEDDLDKQADDFLRNHRYGKLCGRKRI